MGVTRRQNKYVREVFLMETPIYFSVTARTKATTSLVEDFLREHYGSIYDDIESMYGFTTERCKLYGGRGFQFNRCLTPFDLSWMYEHNINYRIPLQNHFVTKKVYDESKWFLDKHHRKGNTIIATSNRLVEWVKRDFPLYKFDASVIQEVHPSKVDKKLELYDYVCIPPEYGEDYDLLDKIKNKDGVILFASSRCERTCPKRTCYIDMSKGHQNPNHMQFNCSNPTGDKGERYYYEFNLKPLIDMGFNRFKLVPVYRAAGIRDKKWPRPYFDNPKFFINDNDKNA